MKRNEAEAKQSPVKPSTLLSFYGYYLVSLHCECDILRHPVYCQKYKNLKLDQMQTSCIFRLIKVLLLRKSLSTYVTEIICLLVL